MMSAVLAGAAGVVVIATGRERSRLPRPLRRGVRLAGWATAGALLVRAVAFMPRHLGGDLDIFDKLDLTVYAPLCVVLGGSIVMSLRATADDRALLT